MLTSMKKDSTIVAAVGSNDDYAALAATSSSLGISAARKSGNPVRVYDLNFLAPWAVRLRQGTSVKQLVSKLFFELVRILAQKNSSVEKLRRVFFHVKQRCVSEKQLVVKCQ